MTAAGYAVQRALERDRTRWLVLAGLLLGFAFLTKMAQAFLVLPGFGVAYLWAGPARLGRRIWQLLAGVGGVIVGAGWWIAIAQLTPAADRPYFGGSTDNNVLELALGYNGLGRLDGSETGSIGGGGGGGNSFGGATGVFRLFQSEFGGQVSWLIPAALISLGALLWISRRAPRTSRIRAFALLWGGWLLVTGVVFSYMQGIIHPYYMVALAPAIGALVGVGAISLLQSGVTAVGRAVAAVGVLVTGIWAYELIERTPEWLPWLRWTVLLAGVLGAISIFAVPELLRLTDRNRVTTGGRRRRRPSLRANGARDRGRPRRAARLLARHRQQHAHRLDPQRRADRGRVVRRRPGRRARRRLWRRDRHRSAGSGTHAGTSAPTGAAAESPGGSGSFPGGASSASGAKPPTGSGAAGSRLGGTGPAGTCGPGRLRRRRGSDGRPVRQHPGQQRADHAA